MLNNKKINIISIVIFALYILMFLGSFTVFKACDPSEDGSFMTCHWAERAVTFVSLAGMIISGLAVAVKNSRTKLGMHISLIFTSIITALIPGVVINMCMMRDMRCWSVMRPAVVAVSVFIIIACAAACFFEKGHDDEASGGKVTR